MLRLLGIEHVVRPAEVDESTRAGESALDYVARLACDKATAVAEEETTAAVLGADTVVAKDATLLGKPSSVEEAETMLETLSGETHQVHTAMALAVDGRIEHLVDTTSVRFRHLTPELIHWYVGTGEPMDKAGAYAIQGAGGLMVNGIEGSPHTVVGLTIHRLPELFDRHGINFLDLLK